MPMFAQNQVADLIARVNVRPLNGICEFRLCNETPQDWGVVVTQGGAKFFYGDGTDFTDGPKPLGLRTGDCYSFYSGDGRKCVKQIFLVINVYVPNEGDATLQYTSEMAPEGKCWTRNGVTLGKNNVVGEAELAGPGTLPFLTFRKN